MACSPSPFPRPQPDYIPRPGARQPGLPPAFKPGRRGKRGSPALAQRAPYISGSAYRIRTGDLLLEREVSWAARRMRRLELAGEEGFEPSHTDPESVVLPLDDSPARQKL